MRDKTASSDLNYCIVTDAASDLDQRYLDAHPDVRMIPMSITIGDQAYHYGPGGDLTIEEFYRQIQNGSSASTSQVNIGTYLNFFTDLLEQGKDILYLCFSSGMSKMYQNAVFAAAELSEEYPEHRILCVDTLCAAPGEGFLVREAVKKKEAGMGLTDLASWAESSKWHIHHWITVDKLEYLHRGGRISTASAVLGTALQIKPLLCVDEAGALKMVGKLRGMKRTMSVLTQKMEEHWLPEQSVSAAVVHACCPERADEFQHLLEQKFPEASVYQSCIGPVIGAHTGPGLLALVFWGDDRSTLSEAAQSAHTGSEDSILQCVKQR